MAKKMSNQVKSLIITELEVVVEGLHEEARLTNNKEDAAAFREAADWIWDRRKELKRA